MPNFSPLRTFKVLMTCAVLTFGGIAHAQQVFKMTAIPDESPTELARKAGSMLKYLEDKLGINLAITAVTLLDT